MAEGPLTYFRIEAQELVASLTRGLLDLEQGEGPAALDQCFRSAHTLKGAARVVKQLRIGEIAHAIEDALAPYRESGDPLPGEYVGELLRLVETIRGEVALLEPAPPSETLSQRRSAEEERFETVRVVIAEMDELLDGLAEAAVKLGPLRGAVLSLGEAPRRFSLDDLSAQLTRAEREISAGLGRVERELTRAQARVRELRLVPAGAAVGRLELAVRDAGEALGKRVQFEAVGGDIRIDGHILAGLRDALLHIVRNGVDHGIEPASERARAGKPPVGRVRLRIERRGGRVAFICSDDGRGVDVTALRAAAVRSGLYPADRVLRLSADEALELMFRAGLSTRDVVTPISGRGVGLDVVRATAAQLKGQVSASSEPGKGTTVEIVVPVSLTALTALTLTSGRIQALLPIDAVRGVRRLTDRSVYRGDEGSHVLFEDAPIPFAPLSSLLDEAPDEAGTSRVAVIVRGIDGVAAIGADRLLNTADVVVKPLPRALGAQPLIAGAAFDETGDPVRVLDPDGLLLAVRASRALFAPHRKAPPRPPILVIDDSLTTRMLEQSILESEGYEVDLCASAEEGLKKAGQRRYGLFIVDVEMPGMNGFEFAETARDEPALSGVPVMMVTSFTSGDARERGARAGVRAYIVKGEFDQREFIGKVAELLAESWSTMGAPPPSPRSTMGAPPPTPRGGGR
jgi:two-component system, chemotaxis family, sensor kinase CheA